MKPVLEQPMSNKPLRFSRRDKEIVREQNFGDSGDCAVIRDLGPKRTTRYLASIKMQPLIALDNEYRGQPLASAAE